MFIKLDAKAISNLWPTIRQGILETIPPPGARATADAVANMLHKMLNGDIDVWVSCEKDKLNFCCITTEVADSGTGQMSTLIYALFSLKGFGEEISEDEYREGFSILAQRARSLGHTSVWAITDSPHVAKLAQNFGANTEKRMLEWSV